MNEFLVACPAENKQPFRVKLRQQQIDTKGIPAIIKMMKILPLKIFICLFAGLFIIQSSVFWERYELKGFGFQKNSSQITPPGISHGSIPVIQTNLNQRFYHVENYPNSQFLFPAALPSKTPLLAKKQPGPGRPAHALLSASPHLLQCILRI